MNSLMAAARGLSKAPVMAAVAVLSLAMAIGPNAAILALIDAVLLRPLPAIQQPEQLVSIYHTIVNDPKSYSPLSWPDFEYYRRAARSFSEVLAYLRLPMAVRTGDRIENIPGELVSENYFRLLGVRPLLGRDFEASEPAPVVILGERLWRDRFGADRSLVGRIIPIAGKAFTVIGIAPAAFRGIVLDWGDRPQLWVPMHSYREAVPALSAMNVLEGWGMQSMLVTGRLADGVTFAQASTEIEALSQRINIDHPERERVWRHTWAARTLPLAQARFWPGARTQVLNVLLVLIAVAAGVLVIACANLASLLLTRAAQRRREISVRIALGARAPAVLRLLLAESLLISAAGCTAGLLLGIALTRGLSTFPKLFSLPLAIELSVDWRVITCSALTGLLVSVLTGVLPIRHCMRADLASSLRATGAAAQNGRGTWNMRGFLTALQIALSLVLLVQAGLFYRTLQRAVESEPFLQAGNLLIAQVELPLLDNAQAAKARLVRDLPASVREIPAVQDVSLASVLPLSGRAAADITVLEPAHSGEPIQSNVNINTVTAQFLKLSGATLLRGRTFAATDTSSAPAVALVNQPMANRHWNGDAIGKRIQVQGQLVTVVGIVRDRMRHAYRADLPPRVYFPIAQRSTGPLFLILSMNGDPTQVLPALRAAVSQLEPDAVLRSPQTLAAFSSVVLAQERLAAWSLGALAIVALTLSLVGLYGTVAYAVTQRKGEIGIRMALGATSPDIVKEILRPVIKMSAAGLLAGALLCTASLRISEYLLFGVEATDPSTWILASLLLAATALLAAAIPAAMASRIDPARVLRAG